jgi:hypothetical protein
MVFSFGHRRIRKTKKGPATRWAGHPNRNAKSVETNGDAAEDWAVRL